MQIGIKDLVLPNPTDCWQVVVWKWLILVTVIYSSSNLIRWLNSQRDQISDYAYQIVKDNQLVQLEFDKIRQQIRQGFNKDYLNQVMDNYLELPETGITSDYILKQLQDATNHEDINWIIGKVSGTVYHGQPEHLKLQSNAGRLYAISNPLHPDVWPSLRKMEAEIVSMTVNLMKGGDKVCGVMTSGGTESIILSCKTHRDYYWDKDRNNNTKPNMISFETVHPAFDKAAELLGIRLIKVKILGQIEEKINDSTIMIIGSAPDFPYGLVDPIKEMAMIAHEKI